MEEEILTRLTRPSKLGNALYIEVSGDSCSFTMGVLKKNYIIMFYFIKIR